MVAAAPGPAANPLTNVSVPSGQLDWPWAGAGHFGTSSTPVKFAAIGGGSGSAAGVVAVGAGVGLTVVESVEAIGGMGGAAVGRGSRTAVAPATTASAAATDAVAT